MIKVGIIGVGTVGTSVAQILKDNADVISARAGVDISVKSGVVKNLNKDRGLDIIITDNVDDILNDDEIDRFEDLSDYLDSDFKLENITEVVDDINYKLQSSWTTLFINGGKKKKVRAGDILGALTRSVGLQKEEVGKIDILEHCSYVAIKSEVATKAAKGLEDGKIKGRFFRVFKK